MAKNVSIDALANEISMMVAKYSEDVEDAIQDELDSTSKAVLNDVKANSPTLYGDYKKGWTKKKFSNELGTSYIVYNKDKPGLVHLLEKGHALRGGGRTKAIPHVAPAVDTHLPAMEKNIENIISKGGK